jgi:hypothetical protein
VRASGEGDLSVIDKFDAKAVYSNFGDSRPGVSVFDAIAVDPSTCAHRLPADRLGVDPVIGRERLQKN